MLVTLHAVLAEGIVARAAKRLRLSPPAMSRALARLRETTGDPLLVRAGRALVPTPRALELRERVSQLIHDAEVVLRPAEKITFKKLAMTFCALHPQRLCWKLRFGSYYSRRRGGYGVRLCLVQKPDKEGMSLREPNIDLENGVVGKTTVRRFEAQALFRNRFIGAVRMGHAVSQGEITGFLCAGGRHICVSRRGLDKGPIDEALKPFGLEREIVTIVGGFSTALALARAFGLIASVPERQTGNLRAGMHSFSLPVPAPEVTISLLWHPRLDADLAHRWLRGLVLETCTGIRLSVL